MAFVNDKPMPLREGEARSLPLDAFPSVDDFAVTLTNDEINHVIFTSARLGRLAGFPAWEHADRDLRHLVPGDVPIGTIDEPFEEEDEDWRIVIFEHAGWVYVLEGRDPKTTEYDVWFRVPDGRYVQAWAALIDLYNPITPLDATEGDA